MRSSFLWFGVVAFLIGCAHQAVVVAEAIGENPSADQILTALQKVGVDLKNFKAKVSITQNDDATGDSMVRSGEVVFQKRDQNADRIRVQLPDYKENGKQINGRGVEYLLQDGWLWDRNYKQKQQVKRQVLKPGEKLDLFKLGEGPFPLPIGQDPGAVKEQFDVKLIPPDPSDPKGTAHLKLTPLPTNKQMAKKFQGIDVWADKETGFPRQIDTVDKTGPTRRTTLDDLKVNDPSVSDDDFKLSPLDEKWQQTEEPLAQ